MSPGTTTTLTTMTTTEVELITTCAVTIFTVLAKEVRDWHRGRHRDRRHDDALARRDAALDTRFGALNLSLEQRFNTVDRSVESVRAEVKEVRDFCVGPDGRNGMRSDLRRIEARVIGLEDRERDRHDPSHAPYDRRQA